MFIFCWLLQPRHHVFYFHWLCCVANLLHCSSSSPDPSETDMQGFYFCWMPISSAEFITEQTGSHTLKQHNIQLIFLLKHSLLSPAQKVLLLILRLVTLLVVVFVSHTYNCSRTWLCNHHGNSSVSQLQLYSSAAPWGYAAKPYWSHSSIQWNSRVSPT